MAKRLDIRREADRSWTVYDAETRQAIIVDGVVMEDLGHDRHGLDVLDQKIAEAERREGPGPVSGADHRRWSAH